MDAARTIRSLEFENHRLNTDNDTLRAQLEAAIAFSDENIERLTKLHGQALTDLEASQEENARLEQAGDAMETRHHAEHLHTQNVHGCDTCEAVHGWRQVRGERP